MENQLGLYIHIPFCVKKCHYCDFLSFGEVTRDKKNAYMDALCSELKALGETFPHRKLATIYIGGGTPSVLDQNNFEKLMETLESSFTFEPTIEKTIEVNPSTLNENKAKAYVKWRINRVSMGLQSEEDRQLRTLGRVHNFDTFISAYNLLREHGIKNVNIDIMFGLSGQDMAQWQQTLASVVALEPEHISAYSLSIEPGTAYEAMVENNALLLPDELTERQMFWYGHKYLEKNGYGHYELSNYAKEGQVSKHNSGYWNLVPYIGAGLGAASYYNHIRYKNEEDLNRYINAKGRLSKIRKVDYINDNKTELEEAFFLGLRQLKGVDMNQLHKTYGELLLKPYEQIINNLVGEGLLKLEDQQLYLTRRGVNISNVVMSHFILN